MLIGFSMVAMVVGSAVAMLFGLYTNLGWIGLVIVYGLSGAACLVLTALVPTMLREINFKSKEPAYLSPIQESEN